MQNRYPGSYLSEKTSVEFATNLRSVDVSHNSYIIAFLDYQTVDVYGFERLEEFKMANIRLFNRLHYDMSDPANHEPLMKRSERFISVSLRFTFVETYFMHLLNGSFVAFLNGSH